MVYSDLESIQASIKTLGLYNDVQVGTLTPPGAADMPIGYLKSGSFTSAGNRRFTGILHFVGFHMNADNVEKEMQDAVSDIIPLVSNQTDYEPVYITFDEDVLDFLGMPNFPVLPPEGAFRIDFEMAVYL